MPADQTSALPIGTRVQISPHLDAWMRGDRYGVVTATTERLTSVRMDRSRRILRCRHDAVAPDPPCGAIACVDCGREIRLRPNGWWEHVGAADGCWDLSLDGPATTALPTTMLSDDHTYVVWMHAAGAATLPVGQFDDFGLACAYASYNTRRHPAGDKWFEVRRFDA